MSEDIWPSCLTDDKTDGGAFTYAGNVIQDSCSNTIADSDCGDTSTGDSARVRGEKENQRSGRSSPLEKDAALSVVVDNVHDDVSHRESEVLHLKKRRVEYVSEMDRRQHPATVGGAGASMRQFYEDQTCSRDQLLMYIQSLLEENARLKKELEAKQEEQGQTFAAQKNQTTMGVGSVSEDALAPDASVDAVPAVTARAAAEVSKKTAPSPNSTAGKALKRKENAARLRATRDQRKQAQEQQRRLLPMVEVANEVVEKMAQTPTSFEHPLANSHAKSEDVRALALFIHERLGLSPAKTGLLFGVCADTIRRWVKSR